MWYWHKERYSDQWNKIESSEKYLHVHGQMMSDKVARPFHVEKEHLFNK
jgi:hypothetical protein